MNPYEVLGIRPSATDDEVKKAYRTLSRKYHPDSNINNPNKAETDEKFRQISEAYQRIMDEREGKIPPWERSDSEAHPFGESTYGEYDQYSSYGKHAAGKEKDAKQENDFGLRYHHHTYTEDELTYIKRAIQQLNRRQAEQAILTLSVFSPASRDGFWYYLSGCAYYLKGDKDKAENHATRALQCEPNNHDYLRLYEELKKSPFERRFGGKEDRYIDIPMPNGYLFWAIAVIAVVLLICLFCAAIGLLLS